MQTNQINLYGRKAIVTGGASGLGFAAARRLLRSGANVALWDLDLERLEILKADLAAEGPIHVAVVNVADPLAVRRAFEQSLEDLGEVDILVNSAGVAGPAVPAIRYTASEWQGVLDVNLSGVFYCCQAVLPHMLERNYGRIVSIASVAGKEGNPNAAAYSASKAGVIALTKSLAKEVAQSGIRINCVTPAAVKTPIFEQITQEHIDFMLSKIPLGRLGEPGEVAALIAWLCSEECSFSTGAAFDLSGGRSTY
ncbi:MAG TPA: SDR family NAD(P)-dependent oxidoreductase [Burkholderiales bacterium]|jgi:3-oxoacyl-[acyl-carrier protein] reductase|nr:SDR family NAD(P)-dependent oxidoreductase [Burkholderiales bacterium]